MKKFFLAVLFFVGLSVQAKEVKLTFFHLNDVYELMPVNGGKFGGLARVQTVVKALKAENPHTYTVLAGDMLSPSALGNAKVDGEKLAGRQMVDVLNRMGWDFFILGNHEFDIGYDALLQRLQEMKFKVFTSNVLDAKTQKSFRHTEQSIVFEVEGVRVGLIGITLSSLGKDFVHVLDPFETARSETQRLKTQEDVDILILVTHQDYAEDVYFAENLSQADLIIGGHEHENMHLYRGAAFTPIAKADANARSAYIHRLTFDTGNKQLRVDSVLKVIDDQVAIDPAIDAQVQGWISKAFAAFRQEGFAPEEIVTTINEPLDGLEASVRNHETRLTTLVADSARRAFKDTEISLINAGSIRIDDVIPPGPVKQYDVLRILPFGGTYSKIKIPGSWLKRTLEVGAQSQGSGAFLHYQGILHTDAGWQVNGKALDVAQIYNASITTYLINEGDKGLEFLVNNPAIVVLNEVPIDARQALIETFMRVYGTHENESAQVKK